MIKTRIKRIKSIENQEKIMAITMIKEVTTTIIMTIIIIIMMTRRIEMGNPIKI